MLKQTSKQTALVALALSLLAATPAIAAPKSIKATTTSTTVTSTTTVAPKTVLGYYTVYYTGDKGSYNSLSNFGNSMNAISTVTFSANSLGGIDGIAPSDGMTLASSKNIKSYAVIQNLTNGVFDGALAHNLLSSTALEQNVVNSAVALVKKYGYKGINIDFEDMQAADRPYYSKFVSDLSTALHNNGATLLLSTVAKTSDMPTAAWSGVYDYAALGAAADQVQIMTYDEHGPWGAPGSVAGMPWVTKVVQYATSVMPSSKVLIGLPAYGYDWNTTAGTGKAVTWKNMPNLITTTGATPKWDATTQSPYFTYTAAGDGSQHTVWYENSQSIQAKTKLVNLYNLGGVSMWRMGLEDASFWQAVQAGLTTP
jgi:spore germination protein